MAQNDGSWLARTQSRICVSSADQARKGVGVVDASESANPINRQFIRSSLGAEDLTSVMCFPKNALLWFQGDPCCAGVCAFGKTEIPSQVTQGLQV